MHDQSGAGGVCGGFPAGSCLGVSGGDGYRRRCLCLPRRAGGKRGDGVNQKTGVRRQESEDGSQAPRLAACAILIASTLFGQGADTVYYNGKIVTLWSQRPQVEALAIRGG